MLRGKILASIVIATLMCGSAMGASIGDVFTEDFESETAGINNFPTPIAAPAPFWVDHQSYWSGTGHYAAPYVAEAYVGNATKMYCVNAAIDANAGANNYGANSAWVFADTGDAHPEEMILSFDMFVREYSINLGPRISLVDYDSGFYRTVGISWAIAGSANPGICIYDPSGANDVYVAAAVSEGWMNYELTVNTNTNTVSLSVDGATPVTTTYTPNSGGAFDGTPDAVEIYGGPKNLDWYAFDNFRLEVTPEPVTLSMLAIGGVLALLRRRR